MVSLSPSVNEGPIEELLITCQCLNQMNSLFFGHHRLDHPPDFLVYQTILTSHYPSCEVNHSSVK